MVEFVTVTFPVRRQVFMDGQPMGHTGDPLTVQPGFHDFDLGSPPDYVPPTQTVNVIGTIPPLPLLVDFLPAALTAARKTAAKAAGKKSGARKKAGAGKKAVKAARHTSPKPDRRAAAPRGPKKRVAKKRVAKKR